MGYYLECSAFQVTLEICGLVWDPLVVFGGDCQRRGGTSKILVVYMLRMIIHESKLNKVRPEFRGMNQQCCGMTFAFRKKHSVLR